MKIIRTEQLEIMLNKRETAIAIMEQIHRMYLGEDFDDAGMDYFTDSKGNTYVGDKDWKVHENPLCAALIDSYNILTYGHAMKIKEQKKFIAGFIVDNRGDSDVGIRGFEEEILVEMHLSDKVATTKEDEDFFVENIRSMLKEMFSHETPAEAYTDKEWNEMHEGDE